MLKNFIRKIIQNEIKKSMNILIQEHVAKVVKELLLDSEEKNENLTITKNLFTQSVAVHLRSCIEWRVMEEIYGESFVDKIVARINRKQLDFKR